MNAAVFQSLGGLGLFLFGMAVMTSALRSLADEKLRNVLAHAVNSPFKGALTGAASTAILQSSSATTVAAVGFVGAGLLTFSQSLGVIFGANIGTTITGWFVVFVGFKLNLGQMLLPVILIGVLLRMTGRPRLEQLGMTAAGFGLIFVGIGSLQEGLSGLREWVTPDQFPSDTVWGRLLLVLIGIIITVITQSSSAGVATALTAVHTDSITLNQAAAMVIGMDVGTTASAALATIGGNVQARRTGFAHVIYNSFTGIGAFFLLTPYMLVVEATAPRVISTDPELVLVGFHTFFNSLGVLLVLPFTDRFATILNKLFPERGNPLTRRLGQSLQSVPDVSLSAVGNTLWDVTISLLAKLQNKLRDDGRSSPQHGLDAIKEAIKETNRYLQEISIQLLDAVQVQEFVSYAHVLDHLRRIEKRTREDRRLTRCRDDQLLTAMSDEVSSAIDVLLTSMHPISNDRVESIRSINRGLKIAMRRYRVRIVNETAKQALNTSSALLRMDTARTLRRIGYHIWRISYHLLNPDRSRIARGEQQKIVGQSLQDYTTTEMTKTDK